MKKIVNILSILTLFLVVGCQEDEKSFGDLKAPADLQVAVDIVGKTADLPYGDGSGIVKFTATADNAISYKYIFSDGTSANAPSGIYEKRFTQTGTNTYSVNVIATGTGGITTNTTLEVEVRSDFSDDEAVQFLTGGTQKIWYWAAAEPGHLGVGQNDSDATKNYYANYYQAAPFEKAGSPNSSCLYDNKLTFSLQSGQLKYELDNGGRTFFNAAFLSVAGGGGPDDNCLNYDTSGLKTVSLSPSESVVVANNVPGQTRGTMLNFSDGGFMGYYIGQSSYEILSITANRMVVRAVMGGNPALAWYHIFSTSPPIQDPVSDYTNLVFSDEFDVAGAPDPTKWGYDIGAGGWGNNEQQFYTNSPENVTVTGGNLRITAKAQTQGTSNYTSARLKSENKFEFTYGKIEFRAKMPTGGGTWPALWSVGQDIATNTWPACGEIDIMEHRGNTPNVIHGTCHYPGVSPGAGNTNSTTIQNASTEFHVYKAIWTPTAIKFYVDNVLYHSVANSNSLPFNSDFFLIMNVAMGGTFGGAIDPAFVQSTLEVDYVRVYQ
ncbi:glycoside hydrolase family 16 protein [Flavobacterium sp. RSB2_4_14]|uniref:glycoside hydrolase family 16 protein n=1 Tax=Flavobacterium sp. RSB2_4_14 TaxID=3447665 RepID=UPI003F404022